MNFVAAVMAIFSMLGAMDHIIGDKFGIGKEFERGIMLLGNLALAMIGILVISPFIAQLLEPVLSGVYNLFGIDPSVVPAILFANDSGGAPLADKVAVDKNIGLFNGLVVASMMGITVSFTIPYALSVVHKEYQKELLLGILCGIVTIPVGCFVSGIMIDIPLFSLILNLFPFIVFSLCISAGLIFKPNMCVKIFSALGILVKIIITIGLALGILRLLTGIEIIKNLTAFEEAGVICLNASAVITGAFPLIYIASKLLNNPLKKMSEKMSVNETSAMGFIATLATSMTTFEMMNKMDKKGIVLNSAFTVSAAFVLSDHLAFTLAYNDSYIYPMMVGKMISAISALLLAVFIYKRMYSEKTE